MNVIVLRKNCNNLFNIPRDKVNMIFEGISSLFFFFPPLFHD